MRSRSASPDSAVLTPKHASVSPRRKHSSPKQRYQSPAISATALLQLVARCAATGHPVNHMLRVLVVVVMLTGMFTSGGLAPQVAQAAISEQPASASNASAPAAPLRSNSAIASAPSASSAL